VTDPVAEAKQAARAIWAAGDFDTVYRLTVAPVGERVVRHVGVREGERVLDVACGSGNAALPAAEAGAAVVGLDLVPSLLAAGRAHAAERGVEIEWIEGDAEELPFEDGSFDVVVSTFGVMFAPRHAVAAGEIARVLRPGGRIGLCNWTTDGSIGEFFQTVTKHVGAPPPPEPPVLWGSEDHVRELFAPLGLELELRHETVEMRFPSPEEAVELFSTKFGPVVMAKAALEPQGRWEPLRDDLLEMYRRHQADDGVLFPAEYLVTLGRKA
jgi:SAM-dependent methyltransferase